MRTNMYTPITFTHYKRETLLDDFGIWWNMPKYRKQEIEAKKYGNQKIVEKKVVNYGCPGPEKDVKYWVVLENGKKINAKIFGKENQKFWNYFKGINCFLLRRGECKIKFWVNIFIIIKMINCRRYNAIFYSHNT